MVALNLSYKVHSIVGCSENGLRLQISTQSSQIPKHFLPQVGNTGLDFHTSTNSERTVNKPQECLPVINSKIAAATLLSVVSNK